MQTIPSREDIRMTLTPRRRWLQRSALALTALLSDSWLTGCASMDARNRQRQVASVLSFLFPGKDQPPPSSDAVAVIQVPFRIGVAFVPDTAKGDARLSETERQQLADKVREAFAGYPFIRQIETVPSLYLEPGGGFANLDRVAALLNLDVVALISYDQVQHADASGWSFLYWTGVGAYVIEGDRFEVLTAVECTVFDIRSRRLLMRASGTATRKGEATMVGFGEKAREGRSMGFSTAMDQMIGNLRQAVQDFRERAPRDPNVRLQLPAGYDGKDAGGAKR
ncbi:MAG: rhombotarget lipoprotein [Burkholderiales bacterium]|jgi:rhombotail lipoprotein|nr:rhombotarget lipoprotein [Burkholderiales bacterium]MBP7519704.1 rhombotarget lipoprotein [Leptothrix sp. (in: b-proteobacteria)]HQY08418.1 rhombotarget lipoprotein [Burkholderiaceae bacterium]